MHVSPFPFEGQPIASTDQTNIQTLTEIGFDGQNYTQGDWLQVLHQESRGKYELEYRCVCVWSGYARSPFTCTSCITLSVAQPSERDRESETETERACITL